MYNQPEIHWYHGRIDPCTTLISCDGNYFREHASPFIQSCSEQGEHVHLHVINPDKDTFEMMNVLKCFEKLSMSYEENSPRDRVYYACNRFIVASVLLNQTGVFNLMISDVDALLMRPWKYPNEPIGLFLREPLEGTIGWEKEGTKIAAGLVYLQNTEENRLYMGRVADYIMYEKQPQWFLDQIALNACKKYITSPIHVFDNRTMDWEFSPDSTMWTGKGDRKYKDVKYLAKKREFFDKMLGSIMTHEFNSWLADHEQA